MYVSIFSRLKLDYVWKMRGYPQFSSWIPIALAKICFSHIVISRTKYLQYKEAPSLNMTQFEQWVS